MDLLERFTTGDADAFEILFRQYQKSVFGWIMLIVRNATVSEELTVETFWRVYRSHARFDPARSFGAWTRRIATNVALDHLKSCRNEIELSDDHAAQSGIDPAVQHDARRQIQKAFSQLPLKLRITATLALVEEVPYEEIADSLGIPVGTVKSRVFRATRILRSKLKNLGENL